jgi:hypothetical protein
MELASSSSSYGRGYKLLNSGAVWCTRSNYQKRRVAMKYLNLFLATAVLVVVGVAVVDVFANATATLAPDHPKFLPTGQGAQGDGFEVTLTPNGTPVKIVGELFTQEDGVMKSGSATQTMRQEWKASINDPQVTAHWVVTVRATVRARAFQEHYVGPDPNTSYTASAFSSMHFDASAPQNKFEQASTGSITLANEETDHKTNFDPLDVTWNVAGEDMDFALVMGTSGSISVSRSEMRLHSQATLDLIHQDPDDGTSELGRLWGGVKAYDGVTLLGDWVVE